MRRSGHRANSVTQQIRDLRPGRLYSLKLITGNYQHLQQGRSEKQRHTVSIRLGNAEEIEDQGFQEVTESSRGQEVPTFSRGNQPWFNYHWRLFRATAPTATLTISDWKDARDPGGPIGEELVYNFVELQPYYPVGG